MKESRTMRNIKEISAMFLLVAGVAFAFIALLMPPPGEIHDSVLYIFAQCLIYAGSIFGIALYVQERNNNPPNGQAQ